MLEALSIMVIARVPECLEFHVGHGEQGSEAIKVSSRNRSSSSSGRAASGERVSGCVCLCCSV